MIPDENLCPHLFKKSTFSKYLKTERLELCKVERFICVCLSECVCGGGGAGVRLRINEIMVFEKKDKNMRKHVGLVKDFQVRSSPESATMIMRILS